MRFVHVSPGRQRGSVIPALVFLVALLAVGIFVSARGRTNSPQNPSRTQEPSQLVNSDATSALIYGVRYGSAVEVRQINSDGTNDSIVAKLTATSRDINVLNPQQLLFIGGLNYENGEFGRGKTIEKATVTETPLRIEKLYELSDREAWGIDELIISPDRQYIAWWEIKSPPGVLDHSSFASRTWVMPTTGGTKIKIAEESESQSQKTKPLFFDNQNRLYTDTVAPNPYDFFLGIKRFTTTGQDLGTFLADGSYNAEPQVSPDGKYAVYTMYDGSQPAQNAGTLPSTRVTNINPNTLILHNLTNDQKTTVGNSSGAARYDSRIIWSHDSTSFAFSKLRVTQYNPQAKTLANGMWRFKIDERDPVRLRDFVKNDDGSQEYIAGLDPANDIVLYGLRKVGEKGNLGGTIPSPVLREITAYSKQGTAKQYLTTGGYEHVSMLGKGRGEQLAIRVPAQVIADVRQLKLRDFELPSPPPPRVPGGTNPRGDCQNNWQKMGYPSPDICELCPLYLYTAEPTQVSIKVNNARVVSSSVPYEQEGFTVVAHPNGQLIRRDGQQVSRIDYDYVTANVSPPTRGYVVSDNDLSSMLWWYATNLGLNNRETEDFVAFWLEKLPKSQYYFMGHYNQAAVKQQLDLTISPTPDTLLQVIMYFKPLSNPILVEAPSFAPIMPRIGFVAVDFSGRID